MLIKLLLLGAAFLWAYMSLTDEPSPEEPGSGGLGPAVGAGAEGERQVSSDLQRHLVRLCEDDWLLFNGLILVHAPGSVFPTAEIDHLVIAPFGIFVIETKHWAGAVTSGETNDELMLATLDGQRVARTSPLKQNASKVRFIKGLIPPRLWLVEGLGVFSHGACTVDPVLPATLLERGELYRHLRMRQQQFARTKIARLPVQKIAEAVMRHADTRPEALAEHRQRIEEGRARKQI